MYTVWPIIVNLNWQSTVDFYLWIIHKNISSPISIKKRRNDNFQGLNSPDIITFVPWTLTERKIDFSVMIINEYISYLPIFFLVRLAVWKIKENLHIKSRRNTFFLHFINILIGLFLPEWYTYCFYINHLSFKHLSSFI